MSNESSPAEAAAPSLPGITLRPQPFSRGPLAAVYRGWDRVHRCDVVVKVQRETDDLVAMNRFGREAAVMQRLRHPSIVTLYAFHQDNPAALIMEYVPGPNLAALVVAEGRLSPARTARIIEEIAAALDCVHAFGIIHRDVKPSNILLPRRGPAKLTDFGVARIDDDVPLTVMGDILGTIEYASPEQVHGNGAVDIRSDVYSLAAVTYFALTGTPPFRAADNSTQAQLSVMHRQVFAEPPPLRFHRSELDPAIEAAVLRGLAKAPEGRYASAGQLAAALRAAVVAASGEPQQSAAAESSRRTGALAGAFGAAVLLLAGVALWKASEYKPSIVSAAQTPVSPAASVPKPALSKPLPPKKVALAAPVISAASVLARPASAAAQNVSPKSPAKSVTKTASAKPPKPKIAGSPAKKLPLAAVVPAHSPALIPARKPVRLASQNPPKPLLPKPLSPAPPPAASPKSGWLRVYATQNTARLGQPDKIAAIPAQTITVDGKPAPALASGHWISLPAGRHWVSFYPGTASEFGPRTHVPVTVAPGAHVGRQVLLAVATGAAPHAAATTRAAGTAHPASHLASQPAASPAASGVGWYAVSGWIAAQTPAQKTSLIPASAQWITVDGQPLPPLASGQWAKLPAGKHLVTFQPTPGMGVGPKTWAINIAPSRHLNQQVPLPPAPMPDIPTHLRNP